METECYLSIKDAAELMGVTKQALYVALAKKRLKAQKIGRDYRIYEKDLKEYERSRYRRNYAGRKDDEISIPEAAKLLNVKPQFLYHATRTGKIKFRKSGYHWLLDLESLITHLGKKAGIDKLAALLNMKYY
jgi:excisionase family DNA binding protein